MAPRRLHGAHPETMHASADLDDPDYVVTGELGRGGMAVVWLAEQVTLAREVAIKRSSHPHDRQLQQLLLREALITGQLEHPNIVPVHGLIGDAGGPAVVMKRLSGCTWDALIQTRGVALERHLEILMQVSNAAAFAHSRGIVHRDIKPENVMIGDYGEVYLLDWGMALRLEDPPSDIVVGTPRYMAPEMARGVADARTDVFLLGACLHEVVTGQPRHGGEVSLEVLYNAMHVEPYAYGDDVPDELAAICNRATARDPDARFPSATALRSALETFREHRAANLLSEAAEAQLEALHAAIASSAQADAAIQHLCARVRFGFEAALRVWPESPTACEGLHACLRAMVDYEIAQRRPDAALVLLDLLTPRDRIRAERVRALQRELAERAAHLSAIERDLDPRFGAPDRARAWRAMALATLAMALTASVQRLFFPGFRTSTQRLVLVGAGVLMAMGVIIAWWRKHGAFNLVNRRIAQICLGTLGVSFASRLSGYLLHTPAEQVLISDAFILGLGGAALSAFHRVGPWLSLLSFTVAMAGSFWPDAIETLFIALSVFVPVVLLLYRRFDRAPRAAGAIAQRASR